MLPPCPPRQSTALIYEMFWWGVWGGEKAHCVLEWHLWNIETCQPTLLERARPPYQISRGRTLETCIPRQWGLTRTLSQPMVSTMPGDQSRGHGLGQQVCVFPGHKEGTGRGEKTPRHPAGCQARAKTGVGCRWDQRVVWIWCRPNEWAHLWESHRSASEPCLNYHVPEIPD